MTPADTADHCLGLPGAAEEYPFGERTAVFKVAGKIFAVLADDAPPARVSLKLPPDEVEALKAEYPGTVLPGYHLNKRHWVTVRYDGVLPDEEILALVEQSYDTVVATLPKKARPARRD
ncbi:MmcQ/YjbR family DNA-binding protein [Actinomadura parmotrematis]|uniref:MmcQ/YjbR family DNA-binding protein n=1 Tax=Actinomadura parmotrematis TaxID=2864039 RepID=A0ABS7FLF8_9ACTN|nr:MmcQ/YjbR family DNA-binding protein [Actinomadura parmotrematis]MBW8481090.1 MmcQ/YjbR family DNA-binding protein [Actinomadura parmotrematis]